MVSAVAPQSPTFWGSPSFFGLGTRQGPIEQFLQQLPSAPIGQGFMFAARSKTVSIPSLLVRSIISCVALHTVNGCWSLLSFTAFSLGAGFFAPVFLVPFGFSAITNTPLLYKIYQKQLFKQLN
jgi:hypothetical protein